VKAKPPAKGNGAYFRVPNYKRFQHYKDRRPPWIKLHVAIFDDMEFGALPDDVKWHVVGIWVLASKLDNCVPFDAEWVTKKIDAVTPVDLEGLASLGWIKRCKKPRRKRGASTALADSKQGATSETETETEAKGEERPDGAPF